MDALTCPACAFSAAPDPEEPWQCPNGHPLEYAAPPQLGAEPPTVDALAPGVWTFETVLPETEHTSMGEGWTPLVPDPEWGSSFKLEYLSPTRSFKDRGATVLIARAAGLGVDRVLEDSSGNAGAAIATYAAHAGLDADIYIPASTPDAKRRRIERTGADVVTVDGPRDAATAACHDAVAAGDGWYASHAWHPAFAAGTATFAYELAAQRGWRVPDAVVLPVGHGTLLLGAYRGFDAMATAGWTDAIPELYAVQAAGTAPLVAALDGDAAAAGDNTIAAGVQIEAPARFTELKTAVQSTGGTAIAVDSTATSATLDRLHRSGYHVEPTAAIAPAALEPLRTRGHLGSDDEVVVPLTGAGSTTG